MQINLNNCRVKLETAIETLLGVTAEQVGMSEITPEVMQQFKNHKSILLKTRKTKMDLLDILSCIFL